MARILEVFRDGGEAAVMAAAPTAISRVAPAIVGRPEPGPYRVAPTTHHERRPAPSRERRAPRSCRREGSMEEGTSAYQLYVGIDIAADTFTAAWCMRAGKPTLPCTAEQTPAGFATLQRRLAATG